ncbi:hypothetical protein GCM10027443_35080 [Pontibacter brevis]
MTPHFRLLLCCSLLLLFSCQERKNETNTGTQTDHSGEEGNVGDLQKGADLAAVPQATLVLDTSGLSPEPDTPLKLLMEGTYHKNEVWRGAERKEWLGLYYETGKYLLRPTTVQVNTVEDPVGDNEGMLSGREVVAADSDAVLLLTGLHRYQKEQIDTAVFSRTTLPANKALTYTFKGKDYLIKSFGDSTQATSGEYSYRHYGWKVAGTKNGKRIEQLLAEDEAFDDSIYVLLWAGDLDNDGIPDLLLDLSNHYNVARYTLFLSSKAQREKLYEKVAVFEVVGC